MQILEDERGRLRVGQIGVGNFGAFRRSVMRETGLFDLVAAYDTNPAALAVAHADDGARPCASFGELLDFAGLEGVIISTGAKFHAAQMIAALERGLPVFVEKPLCSSPEEMDAILKAARAAGVPVVVGHHDHAHNPCAVHIKSAIRNGEMGQLVAVEATTCHSGGFHIQPGDWRGDPGKNPGGFLFQCGVHKLHELMFYLGPVARVTARLRYDVNPRTATADVAICLLEFESGVLGTLNAYHVTPYRHTINLFGTCANYYVSEHHPEGIQVSRQLAAPNYSGAAELIERLDLPSHGDRTSSVRSWYGAIRCGSAASPSLEDGARAVAVVFAAETSARVGHPVDVPKI